MSLKLGGNKSKTQAASTESFTKSTTPVLPSWAGDLTGAVAGRVGGLLGLEPAALYAGPHGLEQQAAAGAASLGGGLGLYGEAAELARGAAQPGQGYQARFADPFAYEAVQGSGRGYEAQQILAAGYDPAMGLAPRGYEAALGLAQGYEAAGFGGARVGPVATGEAASLLEGLSAYQSPYRQEVLDAALADFDFEAGQTRARQDLELAGSGAFGGSGAALTRSATEDALARGRATTSANLRDQMFQRATALAGADADRRQQAGLANLQARNQAGLAQAGFDQEAGLAGAAGINAARGFGAAAANQQALADQQARNAALGFGAAAWNQQGLADQQALNEARRYGAEATNQARTFNAQAGNAASQYGAESDNQFALANLAALNTQRQFGAGQGQQAALAKMAAANEAGRYNAGAVDQGLARRLDAARILSDLASGYGADQRADIAAQAGLGETLRGVEQTQRQAPVLTAQQIVAMLSGLPISLFAGEESQGTTTGASTSKTKGVSADFGAGITKIPGVTPW